MPISESWASKIPPVFLTISLFSVFMRTLAPGLSWANGGTDGGDLITAAATGGVPHPSGYPTYVLLARLFQSLPVGSLAFRTNLMSALATCLAAGMLYLVIMRFFSRLKAQQSWLAGLSVGYAFGLAPLIWSQAVITEVYALHAFFTVLILFLATYPTPALEVGRKHLERLLGLVCGLAIGNHLTSALFVPVALLASSMRLPPRSQDSSHKLRAPWRGWKPDPVSLRRQSVWLGIGVSIYLLLPLLALSRPVINWGNPVTPGRLWWLVSGQLYQPYYLGIPPAEIFPRLQAAAFLLLQQFDDLGVLLGFIGLVIFFHPSKLYALTTWLFVVSSLFAMIYGTEDSYVYLIPAFTAFAIWIGLSLNGLILALSRRLWRSAWLLYLVYLLYLLILAIHNFPSVDASHDMRAEDFGKQVLMSVPEGAIVFSEGDKAVFTLWYFHFALEQRPDLVVIAKDLLHFDWYQENLRSTYPSIIVPGPFPWPESVATANPARPACHVAYTDRAEIECFSP